MPECDFCHKIKSFVTTVRSDNPGTKKVCEGCIIGAGGILNLLNKANHTDPKLPDGSEDTMFKRIRGGVYVVNAKFLDATKLKEAEKK